MSSYRVAVLGGDGREVHVAERPHSARPLVVPHPDSRWVAMPPHPLWLGRRHPAGADR